MKKRLFTLPMLILVFAAILFAGCDSGSPATPTVLPNDTSNTPGINITQADYDAAYAKWKALNVQEYNVNFTYTAFTLTAGTWNINVANGKIMPTSFERGGTPTTIPTTGLDLFTVEGMFNTVARGLSYQQIKDDTNYVYRYEVTFDPNKGYPTHISVRNVPNPINGSTVADTDSELTVHSLEVVK